MGIITLLIINSTISFIEENNAGNAAAALMARLAPKAKVSKFSFFCYVVTPVCVYIHTVAVKSSHLLMNLLFF